MATLSDCQSPIRHFLLWQTQNLVSWLQGCWQTGTCCLIAWMSLQRLATRAAPNNQSSLPWLWLLHISYEMGVIPKIFCWGKTGFTAGIERGKVFSLTKPKVSWHFSPLQFRIILILKQQMLGMYKKIPRKKIGVKIFLWLLTRKHFRN